jgi:hypothetical protein
VSAELELGTPFPIHVATLRIAGRMSSAMMSTSLGTEDLLIHGRNEHLQNSCLQRVDEWVTGRSIDISWYT